MHPLQKLVEVSTAEQRDLLIPPLDNIRESQGRRCSGRAWECINCRFLRRSTAEQLDLSIHTTRCDVWPHCDFQQSLWDNNLSGEGYNLPSPLIMERIGSIGIWPNRVHFGATDSSLYLFLIDTKQIPGIEISSPA